MNDRDDELRKRVELQLSDTKNAEAAKNALALLFPSIERVLQTYVPSDRDVKFQKTNRRISQKDFSHAYFSLNPESATWGRTEFERLIEEGPEVAFAALEDRTSKSSASDQAKLRKLFLELLDAAFSTTVEFTQLWLDQIIAGSAKLLRQRDRSTESLFAFDNEDRLRWLITNALEKLPVERKVELLKNSIVAASDLTVLTDVIRGIVGDKNPDGVQDRSSRSSLGEEAEDVREKLLRKIKYLAGWGRFWRQARPGQLLWFWWGCDLKEEVQTFTTMSMKSRIGLLGLLEAPISVVTSTAGSFERVNRASWSKIVDIDALTERAKKLSESSASQRERELAVRFLNAVDRDQRR
ncbi:hypothetical protein [Bradyrhizobium sp. OK095]|uniref:hypothetical protein n=1 Tax=Bradyrhizobium sp. OK095 TaxID=1882760 RepID=UPI0008BFFD29|nr:hypothetical protein [Bradyrhizobium sp. OK095]SEN60712.1 hypothetical protein SAMN05443254_109317 [Bradyrhizobium sp. OK095]